MTMMTKTMPITIGTLNMPATLHTKTLAIRSTPEATKKKLLRKSDMFTASQ